MKKLFLFVLLAVALQSAFAQCTKNVIKNEIDEFTGAKKIQIGDNSALVYTLVYPKNYRFEGVPGRMSIYRVDSIYTLKMQLQSPGHFDSFKGGLVEIKLMDGSVHNFTVDKDPKSYYVTGYDHFLELDVTIPIEFLHLIQQIEIDIMRIELVKKVAVTMVKRKKQVMQWANCIEKM